MRAIFERSKPEAEHIRSFWFRPEKRLDYIAGQYTELTLPHDNPDDRGIRRWFTLSSAPGGELVSITTKYAGDDKSSSFKKALFALQPGAEVELAEAMGDFVLPKDASRPLVFVAGGIGLTPFHSIVSHLAETGEQRDIAFLYSVRVESEIVFADLFKSYCRSVTTFVTEPSKSWQGKSGQLSGAQILETIGKLGERLLYISGPEPMVEAFKKDLLAAGVPSDQLVTDDFPGYTGV